MSDTRTKIVVWDSSQYNSLEEARLDGAIVEHMVPEVVQGLCLRHYVDAYMRGLHDAGEKSEGNPLRFVGKTVTLKPFQVTAEVLEWNQYTATVYAESAEDARRITDDEGIVSMKTNDVTWGISGVTDEDISLQATQRNIIVKEYK